MNTRTKLLAAAEAILVASGITGLSVRKVGDEAGVNPTLVTYHFGSIGNLLDELCRLNIEPVLAGWAMLEYASNPDDILRIWLEPMLRPAAFTPGGRALVVLDEIAAHGEGDLRARVLIEMDANGRRLRAALLPHCNGLDEEELRARLRFISGAVIGPPPRSHGAPVLADGRKLDDLSFLLPFARAALGI